MCTFEKKAWNFLKSIRIFQCAVDYPQLATHHSPASSMPGRAAKLTHSPIAVELVVHPKSDTYIGDLISNYL